MNTIESMYVRRSIRKYKKHPVEKDKLIELLKVAMAGPSACNKKPWEFIVVTEEEVLKSMRDNLEFGKYDAPAAIVVCGNMRHAMKGPAERFWVQDCSAAICNMLNAAVEMELGTVWIGGYPMTCSMEPLYEILDLPDYIIPLGVIYVGYPDENKEPRTQFEEKYVSWEKYNHDRCCCRKNIFHD